MKRKLLLLLLAWFPAAAIANTTETVFTLSDDMRTATKYFSKRTGQAINQSFLFSKSFNKSLISYARPDTYSWRTEAHDNEQLPTLYFPFTSSYAYLERLPNASSFLTKSKDNPNRYFLEVDGSTCVGQNCRQDESIISVIVPARFKVINYGATVDGGWVPKEDGLWKVVDGTYTFYRKNLRGASVTLLLEDAASYGYTKMSESFANSKEVEVSNEGNRIRVVMPIEKMFASGSAQMQKAGVDWIRTLATTVSELNFIEMRVEGHTDNVPIVKRTQQGHANNWELSSARASNIVQFLISRGVPTDKLAAVGYADARPIADNSTSEGRARNRRIEFTIIVGEGQVKEIAKEGE